MTDGRRAWELSQLRRPEAPRHAEPDELPARRRRRQSQWHAFLDQQWWRIEHSSEQELRRARATAHGYAANNHLHAETRALVDDGQFVLFIRFMPRLNGDAPSVAQA